MATRQIEARPEGQGALGLPGASRRRFLIGLALVVIGAAALTTARRSALRRWLVAASLTAEEPGPLDEATAATLSAAVLALLEERVEPGHYLDVFRWHAARTPGARALYERFARRVDRAARRAGYPGFRSAPREARRRLLEPLRPARGWERLRRGLLARDDARIARHVVREVFRVFARTDAWLLAGYDAWPGMPRAIAGFGRRGNLP